MSLSKLDTLSMLSSTLTYPSKVVRQGFVCVGLITWLGCDTHWLNLFNVIIQHLELKEIEMMGRNFTWANNLDTPTFEKLDRVLMRLDQELKFPKVAIKALDRSRSSDYTPLLMAG